MTDGELMDALLETFPVLDRWGEVFQTAVLPAEGSDLAADDEEWPYLPTSSLAGLGLASAREHLHAVRVLFVEARELFPSAVPTLCRSALIGASLTAWMLIPYDRPVRLQRSLSLALEDYKRHIQYAEEVMRTHPAEMIHETADEQLSRLKLRRQQVRDLLEPLGGPLEINLTEDIIPAAFEVAVPDPDQRAQMEIRWRSMSGAAHVLAWHYFGHQGTTASDVDEIGVARVNIGGAIDRLVMDYFPAFHVTSAAWRLFDMRCGVRVV